MTEVRVDPSFRLYGLDETFRFRVTRGYAGRQETWTLTLQAGNVVVWTVPLEPTGPRDKDGMPASYCCAADVPRDLWLAAESLLDMGSGYAPSRVPTPKNLTTHDGKQVARLAALLHLACGIEVSK